MLSPSVTVTVQAQELLRAHHDGRLAHEAVAAIPAVFDVDGTTGSQRLTRNDRVIGVATIWVFELRALLDRAAHLGQAIRAEAGRLAVTRSELRQEA